MQPPVNLDALALASILRAQAIHMRHDAYGRLVYNTDTWICRLNKSIDRAAFVRACWHGLEARMVGARPSNAAPVRRV